MCEIGVLIRLASRMEQRKEMAIAPKRKTNKSAIIGCKDTQKTIDIAKYIV
jgi:hypothetical protein